MTGPTKTEVDPQVEVEVPGDTGAPDIVSPTGEEMPRQDHDDVVGDERGTDGLPQPDPVERGT
jgi:hypothetical protein